MKKDMILNNYEKLNITSVKLKIQSFQWIKTFIKTRKNDKVVGVTPAMASGCGMNILAREMPGRFYDVGIETFCSGDAGMAQLL